MTRTTRALLTATALGLLGACATSPIPQSTPSPSVPMPPSAQPSITRPSSPSPSAASASPSASTSPTVAAKKLATAKLPSQLADRRTDRLAESSGGQTAAYYTPTNTADVIHAAISPIGTATVASAKLTGATLKGPATCGTLVVATKPTGACVVPFDTGYLLVNGSGGQSVDVVAGFTSALYATFP